MRGTHAGESPRLGFDHGTEIVSAQCTLLLLVVPNGRQIVFRPCVVQQMAAGVGASIGCRTQGRKRGVGSENAVR